MIVTAFSAMTAVAALAEAANAIPPEDDFTIGPFFLVLMMLAITLILIGIGIVIGLMCLICLGLLVAAGIASFSALIGLLCRRYSAGIRALHYQVLGVLGIPCGIGVLFLAVRLFHSLLGLRPILLIGSAGGITAGLSIAFALDRIVQMVMRRYGGKLSIAA